MYMYAVDAWKNFLTIFVDNSTICETFFTLKTTHHIYMFESVLMWDMTKLYFVVVRIWGLGMGFSLCAQTTYAYWHYMVWLVKERLLDLCYNLYWPWRQWPSYQPALTSTLISFAMYTASKRCYRFFLECLKRCLGVIVFVLVCACLRWH